MLITIRKKKVKTKKNREKESKQKMHYYIDYTQGIIEDI
jgi:hypothetical protein